MEQHKLSSLWQSCLLQLQDKIGPIDFSTWIRPLQPDISENTMILYAPNRFVRDWVQDKYLAQIEEIIHFLTANSQFQVRIREGIRPVKENISTDSNTPSSPTEATTPAANYVQPAKIKTNLNPKYEFHNFVQGKSNQLARAVAQKVAENIGDESSNPLFLYGGTGLGKTHLLHAIGNGILKNNPDARVVYIHSERFVQELVRALKTESIEKFKKFYRSLDALLIDDIQFFAGKEGSQEEFFHTFNSLFERGRQIILTSDRYPKEIEKIEERLKSRFNWGLNVAIEPPELETRVAILLKKAEENNIVLPEEVAFFIGQKLRTNVRELEGALNRVSANATFTGQPITIDFVRETLKDMLAVHDRSITLDNIQKVVAERYRIKVADLKSKSKARSVVRPRQMAMALSKELTNHSLPEIGRAFGDRDHTTVLHACRKIMELKDSDNSISEDYANLIRTLST